MGRTTRREFLRTTARAALTFTLAETSHGLRSPALAQKTEPPRAKLTPRPVTVSIWHTEREPNTVKAFQEIADDFKALYPNITIRQQALSVSEIENRLVAALAAGAPPDCAQALQTAPPSFYAKGLLRPIDDLIRSIGKEDIFEWVRDIAYFDGHWYGLAHAIGADMLIARKDWMDEKGLKEPATWDEWLKVLTAFTDPPKRYGTGFDGRTVNLNEDIFMFIAQNGGRIFDEHGNPTLTEPPVLETLEFFKRLKGVIPPGWVSQTTLDLYTLLAQGKVAMMSGWGRAIGYIERYAQKEVQDTKHFAPLRIKPIGPSGKKMITQLDGEEWMIFKASKYGDEALEFLKFFHKRENYLKYVNSLPSHLLPINKSLYRDATWKNHPERVKWWPWIDTQLRYFDEGLVRPILMINKSDFRLPFLMEVSNSGALASMVIGVMEKGMNPKAAAERAEQELRQLIAQVGGKTQK